MGNSHNHHSDEKKPVAFLAPLIFGLVIMFIILSFVSLGNPSHGHSDCANKEDCSKECAESGKEGKHEETHASHASEDSKTEAKPAETIATETATTTTVAAESAGH
ncbi:MAG: hypothetical protein ACK5QC_03965 [Bacteroidota bacterium]|jgi:hypothetical protein